LVRFFNSSPICDEVWHSGDGIGKDAERQWKQGHLQRELGTVHDCDTGNNGRLKFVNYAGQSGECLLDRVIFRNQLENSHLAFRQAPGFITLVIVRPLVTSTSLIGACGIQKPPIPRDN
jgi:hypothetical protein